MESPPSKKQPDEPDEPDDKTESTAGFAGFADFAGFKQGPTSNTYRSQLATADTQPDLGGCAIALESDGENGGEGSDLQSEPPPMADVAADPDALARSQQVENGSSAYLNSLCRDCRVNPHSAGRTRCDQCHRIWQTTVDGYNR